MLSNRFPQVRLAAFFFFFLFLFHRYSVSESVCNSIGLSSVNGGLGYSMRPEYSTAMRALTRELQKRSRRKDLAGDTASGSSGCTETSDGVQKKIEKNRKKKAVRRDQYR